MYSTWLTSQVSTGTYISPGSIMWFLKHSLVLPPTLLPKPHFHFPTLGSTEKKGPLDGIFFHSKKVLTIRVAFDFALTVFWHLWSTALVTVKLTICINKKIISYIENLSLSNKLCIKELRIPKVAILTDFKQKLMKACNHSLLTQHRN